MSELLSRLVDVERHDAWQASLIFESRKYRAQDSSEASQRRQGVAAAQARLARAIDDGRSTTAQYLLSALGIEDGVQILREVPQLPNPLTIGEMSQLPAHAERQLAKRLHGALTPAQAANPAVWTICHAAWISRGDFGLNLSAMFCEGPRADSSEARTRNFLRRTGGLRRVRGNTSPLVDCPISAAWWRCRVALEVTRIAEKENCIFLVHEAHETLRLRTVWENLVGMSLKQVTAVSASTARAAVVVALEQHQREQGKLSRAEVQGALRELARLSHGHSLWHVSWSTLVDTATRGIESASADDREDEGEPS